MADTRLLGPLLALETSGPAGTVAVGDPDGTVRALVTVGPRRRQAAEVAPAVEQALASAGVPMEELAGILVGGGPGSFTGVRVAAATAKGLAHALDLPLWTASSLASAASAGQDAEGTADSDLPEAPSVVRYVLFDARADRVYGACFRVDPDGVSLRVDPHAGTVHDALEAAPEGDPWFVGAGARHHRGLLEEAGYRVASEPWGEPTARSLLTLAARAPELLTLAGRTWEPDYLRASNAERAWNG